MSFFLWDYVNYLKINAQLEKDLKGSIKNVNSDGIISIQFIEFFFFFGIPLILYSEAEGGRISR